MNATDTTDTSDTQDTSTTTDAGELAYEGYPYISHYVELPDGLNMHYLEAGAPRRDERRPPILLLHGFPELAYSWRKLMAPLASRSKA